MWKIKITHREEEDIEFTFQARPQVSEGSCLFRVFSEEGEFWLPSRDVKEVRLRQDEVRPVEESGL